MLLCSDPGRTTVILRPCRHLHKKWEKILSPFLYPCYVGNLQENLWCRDGVSCRRRRCETREPSSRGLPRGEKVAGMATAPGTTSVGRRESTLGVAGDDRCRLPIVLNRQLALPHGHDAVYRTLTLFPPLPPNIGPFSRKLNKYRHQHLQPRSQWPSHRHPPIQF
jgi:hypothetical protein